MTHIELRQKFIDFWKSKNHIEIPSSSLVPENDPTTLFTGSGMQPMMPYLLGADHPLGSRLVDSQKCFRAQDIEEVGDSRHTTAFEMLGNWSLGDYFKEEQITWLYEFLTKIIGLPNENLCVTVFEGDNNFSKDTETAKIWKDLGILEKNIYYYGSQKNWWSRSGTPEEMPVGEPGGTDSEVFYDYKSPIHDNCHPNCDCGRFLEIGNSVFMSYLKTDNGFIPLKKNNIDFGGGLERMLAAVNQEPDIFKTDIFINIIKAIESETGQKYADHKNTMQIIADHVKASVFLISDGVLPSNKMQGYFLRRLLRRALIKLRKTNSDLSSEIIKSVFETYQKTDYFSKTNVDDVIRIINEEKEKFNKTLDAGLKKIDILSPFDLYQSYGFPPEITEELYLEKGLKFDRKSLEEQVKKHQELSRNSSGQTFKGGLADNSEIVTKYHTATHLLQAALRKVLGDHVHQEGSNINSERLRFDFSHQEKLTPEQITSVENLVNKYITDSLERKTETMTYDEAINSGALAFFKERYPEKVTVYSFGNISREICGGPHVDNTKDIGKFKIIKQEPVASGIKRIYAQI